MATKLGSIPLKARIASIQAVYERAAGRIISELSALTPENYTAAKAGAVLSAVREIIRELNARVQKWAPGAIRAAYKESAGVARTRLEIIGARQLPARKYDPARHDRKIASLTKAVLRDYWKADRTIEKTARRYIASVAQGAAGVKRIAQAQMFDSGEVAEFIKRTVAGSLKAGMTHLTSKEVAAKILAKLLDQIGGGNFIRIRGSDGKERNYNLRDYAELVARTRMRESQTEATKELCAQYDNDLVQFSRHDNPCDDCRAREGQVYSISGNHPHYPKLEPEDEPPIHPRCEHDINPTSETALAWRDR